MGEMVDRIALWLHNRNASETEQPIARWSELPDPEKKILVAAARDLVLTMRRPTLGMRVKGRASMAKGDEGETWRAMIDEALREED